MPNKKKSSYRGFSAAQKKANAKYQAEKVEDIKIRVPKGKREYYKKAAGNAGLSLNQFAIDSMDEKILRNRLWIRPEETQH